MALAAWDAAVCLLRRLLGVHACMSSAVGQGHGLWLLGNTQARVDMGHTQRHLTPALHLTDLGVQVSEDGSEVTAYKLYLIQVGGKAGVVERVTGR